MKNKRINTRIFKKLAHRIQKVQKVNYNIKTREKILKIHILPYMNKTSLPIVHIYSDWGANPNPGPWGYGVIMKCGKHQKDFSQGYKRTTNNRMELMGAIIGFQKLKTKSKITLHTDSQYTINGLQKGWAKKWKANNWYRTKSQKATNHDLWEILLELSQKHEVDFEWIKWHNGHVENELCDQMATIAMQKNDLQIDTWFIEPTPKKQTSLTSTYETTSTTCKKCGDTLIKKVPKHTKKTLEKKYYYEYYHHCVACNTNYMLPEAKRDINTLKL